MIAVLFFLLSSFDAPIRQNAVLTPGVSVETDTHVLCRPGYSKRVRHVTEKTRREVFRRYGVTPSRSYEIDHLISLELGGSNAIENLWPQSYHTQPWNARTKDALENRLHHLVCTGAISVHEAQHAIATDWIGAAQRFK